MIRRPPRSTLDRSSAASDVYKRQGIGQRAPRGREALRIGGPPDRPIGQRRTCRNTERGGDDDGHALGGRGRARGAISPVAYTHLRAHETGRNLVCRLLLEK